MAKNEGGDIKEMGERVVDTARETIEDVKDKASDLYQEGVDKTRELGEYLSDTIREKPIQSVLLAAGVGLLLGRFRVRPFESMLLAAGTGVACGLLWSNSALSPEGNRGQRRRSR
jgi:ElaB/YqjD/DUF883 family membrane-anchored ribosome-binding protein